MQPRSALDEAQQDRDPPAEEAIDDHVGEGDDMALTSVGSPEAVARLLNPFGRLGGRSQPAQAVYDDLQEMTRLRTSVSDKLYK